MRVVTLGRMDLCSLTALALCALTACGGGSDKGSATITAKEGELIVIDAGSSGLAAKTYTLELNYDTSYAVYRDFSIGRLIRVLPENDAFDSSLVYLKGTPRKFLVSLSAEVVGAASGTYKEFACRSSEWTTAELKAISEFAATLPVCSNTITVDEAKRHVAYANISLPALESGGKAVVISATFSWPEPTLDPSLGGPDSGGGSVAVPGPAAQTTPPTPATGGSISITNATPTIGNASVTAAPLAPVMVVTAPN
jgi:hypothetical protein